MKKYKVGFYGGKFMPLHIGHAYCLSKCAEECETAYFIMFVNGEQECQILNENAQPELQIEQRFEQMLDLIASEGYANVIPTIIDVADCKCSNGAEDWDAETPLVRMVCGDRIDAVYGSEPHYKEYFDRAYPEATYILVDPPREKYPISGTMCREMSKEERKEWIV